MSKITYAASSPYFMTPQSQMFLGRYVDRPIPSHASDRTVTLDVKYEGRPDKMSFDLYGSPVYWWVFMRRNVGIIRDPIWDFKAGIRIIVPSRETVVSVLGG